jgi:hypothetical protein
VFLASSLLQYVSISILLFLCSVRDFSLILSNKILAVHDKITNMVFEQIDKQLELVNISMNSTSQTTNQNNSDCYKEMTKMSTARDNMPKWNNEATTTSHDYRDAICISPSPLELVGICAISVAAGGMSRLKKDSWHSICQCYLWYLIHSFLGLVYSRYPICFSLLLRSAMLKWNNEATTTSHDYSLINNSQDTCTSQTIRED